MSLTFNHSRKKRHRMKESLPRALTGCTKGTIGLFYLDYNGLAGKAVSILIFCAVVHLIAYCMEKLNINTTWDFHGAFNGLSVSPI